MKTKTHLAYFVNQYPKVSHSFIRREIVALEAQGAIVSRYALRGWRDEVVDKEDLLEQSRTSYILAGGMLPLFLACTRQFLTAPAKFIASFVLSCSMSRYSDRSLLKHWITLAEAAWLKQRLTAANVQHLHAHFGTNSAEVAMYCNALGGPPYSFTVHGPEEFDKPVALHLREKIERAKFVVAISSFGKSQLYRWVDRQHWGKIKEVHCGLDKGFHDVPHVPVPGTPRLVCIGRLCEQKGQLLLIEAANLLRQQAVTFELVLAGDGEMRPEIEALVVKCGLQSCVRITGWISASQVREELLAARAMVLPSFAEGLPVVIMEALALRRPVLTTYVAGIPELVEPGTCGWLFPAGSVEALAEAMAESLTCDQATLDRMGECGRSRVLSRHDIDQEVAKIAVNFQEVIA